jgi:uncharacterized protein (TIGR03086 family)
MSDDVIQRATQLVTAFDARVQAAPGDSWGNASPCSEWTARDVAVHVTNNLFRVAGGLHGTEPRTVGDDDDIVATWNAARDSFLDGLSSKDLTQNLAGPFGPMPAADLIGRFVCTDVLVHTWDLARATGGDEQLDADAVAGAYSGLKPMDAMIRQTGVFADKVASADGADLQTEFLNFLGRTV